MVNGKRVAQGATGMGLCVERALGVALLAVLCAACTNETLDASEPTATTALPIWSNTWDSLGVAASGGPGAATWIGHNLSLYYRGTDNHLHGQYLSEGTDWYDAEDIAPNLASDPVATSSDDDRNDLFWRGTNNHLMYKRWTQAAGWATTANLGGALVSGPAAVTWPGWFISVFWRGTNNHLKHKWLDLASSQWSGEEDYAVTLASDPAAVFNGNGFDIFWRGTDGQLKTAIYPYNGQWVVGPAGSLGGAIYSGSSPSAAASKPGRIDVFWRSTTSHLVHRGRKNGLWLNPVDDGGGLTSSPEVTSWSGGRIDVFAQVNSTLQHAVLSRAIDVLPAVQQDDQWCWAAAGEILSSYWGHYVSQCAQANHRFGLTTCCSTPIPSACDYPAETELNWLGLNFTYAPWYTALTVPQMQAQIAAGRPWIHPIDWVGGGSHVFVGIDAFWFDNQWWVNVINPADGAEYLLPYSIYVTNPGVWTTQGDVYDIRPF